VGTLIIGDIPFDR